MKKSKEKNVVYVGSRNMYPHIVPSVLSLVEHTRIDMLYLIIEDDIFPYELPCEYKVINAKNQNIISKDSPNYNSYFTYLCVLRVGLSKILPAEVNQVLSLDVDTIIADDISPMWDVDLSNKWMAAVPEYLNKKDTEKYGIYYNCGIVMYNLEQIRKDKVDDKMIEWANKNDAIWVDQTVINEHLVGHQDKAVAYDLRFNECFATGETDNPAIVHFAGKGDWMRDRNGHRFNYLEPWQTKFEMSKGHIEWRVLPASEQKGIKYMIHAVPKRMWYVESFLIPELEKQGIKRDEIHVWVDNKGWGNLRSFVNSMRWVAENCPLDETIWHVQDDILPHSKFFLMTSRLVGFVSYGFAYEEWNHDNCQYTGLVPLGHAWTSFQANGIPNHLAKEFYEWFTYLNEQTFRLMPYAHDGKHDDTIFQLFLGDKHRNEYVYNCYPCVCEHIDYLLGGTTLSDDYPKEIKRGAFWWDEDERTADLEKRVKEYKGVIDE